MPPVQLKFFISSPNDHRPRLPHTFPQMMIFNVINVTCSQSVLNGAILALKTIQHRELCCSSLLATKAGVRHSLAGKLEMAEKSGQSQLWQNRDSVLVNCLLSAIS